MCERAIAETNAFYYVENIDWVADGHRQMFIRAGAEWSSFFRTKNEGPRELFRVMIGRVDCFCRELINPNGMDRMVNKLRLERFANLYYPKLPAELLYTRYVLRTTYRTGTTLPVLSYSTTVPVGITYGVLPTGNLR